MCSIISTVKHLSVTEFHILTVPDASCSADFNLQSAVVLTVLTNYSIIQWTLPVTLIGSVCVAERPCLLDAAH